jgi:histidinol-phosphate aminotransferase
MANPDPDKLVRENIRKLVPYSSARDEFRGNAAILLDANESPYNNPYNRYPDPLQRDLKDRISGIFNIGESNIFLGNGSDEAIDLLIRAYCNPGKDNIISLDPSYGMYDVCAHINDIGSLKIPLNPDFSMDPDKVLRPVNGNTKLIFLCSPNNPTANLLDTDKVLDIIKTFMGIVVVDEAYIDFSGSEGLLKYVPKYPNLVVLRTFSKAWGLAGVRLGMAFADKRIISVLNKIKYPYNINILTQKHVLKYLSEGPDVQGWIREILNQKKIVTAELQKYSFVKIVYPSDANFLLVKVENPVSLYAYLRDGGVVIRDRSKAHLCEGCLRVTIGSEEENRKMLDLIEQYDAIHGISKMVNK